MYKIHISLLESKANTISVVHVVVVDVAIIVHIPRIVAVVSVRRTIECKLYKC